MDPLMRQPTWTIAMAIDLCDGRKYFFGAVVFCSLDYRFVQQPASLKGICCAREVFWSSLKSKADSVAIQGMGASCEVAAT